MPSHVLGFGVRLTRHFAHHQRKMRINGGQRLAFAHPTWLLHGYMALLDKDQSSSLSQEKFATLETEEGHLLRHFTNLDSDGDGKVSETEYSTVMPLGHHGGGGFGGR